MDYQVFWEIVGETHIEFPVDVRILNKTWIPFQFKVFQWTLLVDRDPESRVQRIEYIVGDIWTSSPF